MSKAIGYSDLVRAYAARCGESSEQVVLHKKYRNGSGPRHFALVRHSRKELIPSTSRGTKSEVGERSGSTACVCRRMIGFDLVQYTFETGLGGRLNCLGAPVGTGHQETLIVRTTSGVMSVECA